jgi:hypothetical protein
MIYVIIYNSLFSVIFVSLVKFLHLKTCGCGMDLRIFVDWDC